jgi:hypothetical protein
MLDSALKSRKQGLGSEKGQKAMAQKTLLRTFVSRGVSYPYSEFLGYGPPSMDLGASGDVYLDLTVGSLALYGRYSEEWKIWRGPQNSKAEDLVVHPSHPNRCLWCSETFYGWFAMTFAQGRSSGELQASRLHYLGLSNLGSTFDCACRSFRHERLTNGNRREEKEKKNDKRTAGASAQKDGH